MAAANVAPPKPPLTTDITNSPYLQPLPRASNHDVLGYSRHYARRYQNMGKTSKESWIKKLWSHVFTRKKSPGEQARVDARDAQAQERHRERLAESVERATVMGQENGKAENSRKSVLPPIKQQNKAIRETNSNATVTNSTNTLNTARSKENIAPARNFIRENMGSGGKAQSSEVIKNYPSGYPKPQSSENKGTMSNCVNKNQQTDNRGYNSSIYSRSQSDNNRNISNIYSRSQSNDSNRNAHSYPKSQHPDSHRMAHTRPQPSDSRPVNRYLSSQQNDSRSVASHLYSRSQYSEGHRGLSTLSQGSSERNSRESLPTDRSQNREQTASKSAPLTRTGREKKTLPWELANSPYLPPRDRPTYRTVLMERQKEYLRSRESGSGEKKDPKKEYLHRAFREPAPPGRAKPDYVHITGQVDSWRIPKLSKGVSYAEVEERARKDAAKAMKASKIFSCDLCFPMDAYIRHSLRKRGWVEKFNPTVQNSSCRGGTADRLQCEDDEDFEVICEQGVPAPWEEAHGVYAIMSRLVRNYPSRFIWGGRNVNSLVVKDEVLLNHWPKARYFTSKTSIVESLRESMWFSHDDWSSFFPRCYLLGDEEKEDVVDDFHMTACMSLLKWVLKIYDEDQERAMVEREQAIREEEEPNEKQNPEPQKTDKADRFAANAEIVVHQESDEDDARTIFGRKARQFCDMDEDGYDDNGAGQSMDFAKENTDDSMGGSAGNDGNNNADDIGHVVNDDDDKTKGKDGADTQADKGKDPNGTQDKNAPKIVVKGTLRRYKVLPDISRREQMGGQVPSKAVDWALSQCEHYIRFRQHEDLDQKSQRHGQLTSNQWDTFLKWYYRVAHDNARVSVTASKVEKCSEMLDRMREFWPQIYMDGLRNIWIAKPGAKSKGVGISFCDRLDDIMKYTDNTTLQGNYIVQKYIERPLLFYNCKFDIRQWFLVTDWNPVTVWFYRDSYLRICSQEYSYDSMHESVHLSNVSIQQYYLNGERSDKIPDDNFMDSNEFQEYLRHLGFGSVWDDIIYPGMKRAVICTVMSTLDVTETRKSAFELYGADFMIADDFVPWLLEINASPGMSPSSVEKAKLCAQVVEDTIKVVLDLREDKNAETGRFDLIFKDAPVSNNFRCVESKMYLKGARIKRSVWEKFADIDRQAMKVEEDKKKKENQKAEKKRQKEEAERKKVQDAERLKEERQRQERERELHRLQEEGDEDDDDQFETVQEDVKPKREASEIMETYCPTGDHRNSNNNSNSEESDGATEESERVHFDGS